MALLRSCSPYREAGLPLKSFSSISLLSCVFFTSLDHLSTILDADGIQVTHCHSIPSESRPLSMLTATGCETDSRSRRSVCLQSAVVCRREQRGPYMALQGGLVLRSQWLGLVADLLEEGLLLPQWWITAQSGAAQPHTTLTKSELP